MPDRWASGETTTWCLMGGRVHTVIHDAAVIAALTGDVQHDGRDRGRVGRGARVGAGVQVPLGAEGASSAPGEDRFQPDADAPTRIATRHRRGDGPHSPSPMT